MVKMCKKNEKNSLYNIIIYSKSTFRKQDMLVHHHVFILIKIIIN